MLGNMREPILASWRRSRDWKVPPDRIELSYLGGPALDTPLTRSAVPVLRRLRGNLDGQPVAVLLADASGVVQARMTADDELAGHLDEVMLAPGYSYAESSVGTNGLGTALESGQAAHIFGPEHYAEPLRDLASAAVPIRMPISGKLAGAAGLTCWCSNADPLLMALVKTAADQITRELLTEGSAWELELLRDYLRACWHGSGIVLALNHDLVMMNDRARHVLEPGDTQVLLRHASEALAGGRANAVQVELPTGLTARMHCRPTASASLARTPAGVVQVRLLEPSRPGGEARPPARTSLPGLVGSGARWLRSSQRVQDGYDSGEWLALQGEPGAGKLALARAVHQHRNPARRLDVFDAADVVTQDWLMQDWLKSIRQTLLAAEGDLIIRHVDHLELEQANALAVTLRATREGATWVAVTLTDGSVALAELLQLFPTTVEVPSLRHHIEDVPELTQFFLGKLSQQGSLTCSPEAMKLLTRSSWPGNAEQLWQVIRRVVQRRRAGSIRSADLPPECWAVSRRLLSPLEAMERDAIVQGLADTCGNKARAAESLGMSRATIYRKIHAYGIIGLSSLALESVLTERPRLPSRGYRVDLGLDGKVALVAASSKGLGKASALALAREGARVTICARTEAELKAAADEIRRETGAEVLAVPADLNSAEGVSAVVAATVERFGGVDVLVSNSGGPPRGRFWDFTDEDWQQAFEIVTLNFVRFVRETVPYMRARRWGRIIGIQSSSVKQPVDGIDLSNGVRPGIAGLVKALMPDLAKDGITINLVLPGTFLTSRIAPGAGVSAEADQVLMEQLAHLAATIPMGRLGQPAELGSLVAFLASRQASYITGAAYQVDGGNIRSNL